MIQDSTMTLTTEHRQADDRPGSDTPLVVDLDGTLIRTDLLHESCLRVLRDRPLDLLRIPFWLAQGKAVLKRRLAERTSLDPALLPYHCELLDWLKQQRSLGRRLVLCTASDRSAAVTIADHLGIFDEVMASDGINNLSGAHKALALEQRFGPAGYDYAGNAQADLVVWEQARRAIVVNADAPLAAQAANCCEVEQVFPPTSLDFAVWLRVLRVHQWLKNALLFVPVLAAHQLGNADIWLALLLAFCVIHTARARLRASLAGAAYHDALVRYSVTRLAPACQHRQNPLQHVWHAAQSCAVSRPVRWARPSASGHRLHRGSNTSRRAQTRRPNGGRQWACDPMVMSSSFSNNSVTFTSRCSETITVQ